MHRSLVTLLALVSSLSLAAFGCSTNDSGEDEDDVDVAEDALDERAGDSPDDGDDGSVDGDPAGDGDGSGGPCAGDANDCAPSGDPSVPPCDPSDTNCTQAPPPASDCEEVEAMLAALLIEVRSCSILDDGNACSIVVDTTQGCPVPANAASPRLAEYKELFGKFAESCPLPVPACPVPAAMACVQAPDVDSTVGVCEAVAPDADPDDAEGS